MADDPLKNPAFSNPFFKVGEAQSGRLMTDSSPMKYYQEDKGKLVETRRATAVDSKGNTALGVKGGQIGGTGYAQPNTYSNATKMAAYGQVQEIAKAGSDYATARSKAIQAAGDSIYVKPPKSYEPSLVGVKTPTFGSNQSKFSA